MINLSRLLATTLCLALTSATVAHAGAPPAQASLVVTASNADDNELLLYSPSGELVKTIATGGRGGASGNAGGIAQNRDRLAVVNFGSDSVSIFLKDPSAGSLQLERIIHVAAGPVSVALDEDHLYVLASQSVESHEIGSAGVSDAADGAAVLLIGDGSAAQVGILSHQIIVSEKSNAIETVDLNGRGAISGAAILTQNIPDNVDAPFGLVTRGPKAYVTIAHANEISLVQNNAVRAVTGSGTQLSPCWLALDGDFLFSSNSPSHSVSRFLVAGERVVLTEPVAATFDGNPSDITYSRQINNSGLAAVIDSNGSVSHLSVFDVDAGGEFGLQAVATIANPTANGVAIVNFGS